MNEEIRKKYVNDKKEFLIKMRDDEDKVYYNGVKAFEINSEGKIKLENNIFSLNKATIINLLDKKDQESKEDDINYIVNVFYNLIKDIRAFEINEFSTITLNFAPKSFDEKNAKMILENIKSDLIANGLGNLSFVKNDSVINDKLSNISKKISKWKELNKKNESKTDKKDKKKIKADNKFNDNSIHLILSFTKSDVDYLNNNNFKNPNKIAVLIQCIFLINCIFKDKIKYSNRTGFAKPDFKFTEKDKFKFEDENFEDKIKATIEEYNNNTGKYEKIENNKVRIISEKEYQHIFMTNPIDIFENCYPFEEEYYLKEGNDLEKSDKELLKNGRIDCIFLGFDNKKCQEDKICINKIYLIELKINESVIDEPYGIKTHLEDIKDNLCSNDNKLRENFIMTLKSRIEKHLKYDENYLGKEVVWGNNNNLLAFYTVIAYYENHKVVVENKLKEVFDKYQIKDYIKKLNDNYIETAFFTHQISNNCDYNEIKFTPYSESQNE